MLTPPVHITRRVWLAVSHRPSATVAQLAADARVRHAEAYYALHTLRTLGYITFSDRQECMRRVLVPFAEVTR